MWLPEQLVATDFGRLWKATHDQKYELRPARMRPIVMQVLWLMLGGDGR